MRVMTGRTLLVVMTHPDDAELTCDGAVARWVREGDRAILVTATDGARGGKHQGSDARNVAQQRRVEQQNAARIVGYDEAVFLGFPDGELEENDTLRGALVEQIRRHRPDMVVVMDPTTVIYGNYYVNHRDHRVLGMATLDALYPEASNAGYFPEQLERGLPLHKVPETLLVQTEQPNFWVDVSETLDVRFAALRCHESQMRLWPDNGEAIVQQQRELAALLGLEHGFRYAEAYRRIVVNPLG
jgi:LmbE family N-acetylglucosaminyl deacetylase